MIAPGAFIGSVVVRNPVTGYLNQTIEFSSQFNQPIMDLP